MRSPAHRGQRLGILLAAWISIFAHPAVTQADDITVFAAASLTESLTDIGRTYEAQSGKSVLFSFASSSALARQIEAGAPADIYLSANEQWMDYLDEAGLIETATRVSPISNRLVLIVPSDSDIGPPAIDESLDLGSLLGPNGRIAVGDPDHVPAGIYAKEALQSMGLWSFAEPRLARADDVRAALVLVGRGEAPLGIVYSTDAAISDRIRIVGIFPPETHAAIRYSFAVLRDQDNRDAVDFYSYLTGPEAIETFERYGFFVDE